MHTHVHGLQRLAFFRQERMQSTVVSRHRASRDQTVETAPRTHSVRWPCLPDMAKHQTYIATMQYHWLRPALDERATGRGVGVLKERFRQGLLEFVCVDSSLN